MRKKKHPGPATVHGYQLICMQAHVAGMPEIDSLLWGSNFSLHGWGSENAYNVGRPPAFFQQRDQVGGIRNESPWRTTPKQWFTKDFYKRFLSHSMHWGGGHMKRAQLNIKGSICKRGDRLWVGWGGGWEGWCRGWGLVLFAAEHGPNSLSPNN